jgi:hypothetical protein
MHRLRRVSQLLFAAFLDVVFPSDWADILAENFGVLGELVAQRLGLSPGSLADIASANAAGYQDAPWFE